MTHPTLQHLAHDQQRAAPRAQHRRPAAAEQRGRSGRRLAAVGALAAGLALAAAPTAGAHVRVTADSTTPGAYSALTFRVPTESETASTTRVSVQLPQDTPFASVRTRALPGWEAALVTEPLPAPVEVGGATLTKAVRTVTWTAERGQAIAPGEYQDFALSVGPLPGGGTVLLPATQTYSDGEVVRWDQPTPASGEEPEHPAPSIEVAASGTGTGGSGTGGAGTSGTGTGTTATTTAAEAGPDGLARGLGAGALALGAVGAVLAALALRAARATRRTAAGGAA